MCGIVIASIITLAVYLSGIRVPAFVEKTTNLLGGMTAPVSVMIIGASLAATDLKSVKFILCLKDFEQKE